MEVLGSQATLLCYVFNNHHDHCFTVLKYVKQSCVARSLGVRRVKINLLQYCSLRRQTFLFRSTLCWFFTFPRGKSTCAESFSRDEFCRAEGCSTSVTKSHKSDAIITSIPEPASKELTFDPVVLRATEDCFLHVQLIGTKTGLPKMRKMTSKVFLES